MNKIENGKATFSLEILLNLAETFEVDVKELVDF